jgi:starch-binding outer membrane protein SusE/F
MKKQHINISFLILILFIGWSCSEDSNLDPEGNWELSTPAIASPANNAEIDLDELTPAATFTINWTQAVSSVNYGVRYYVIFDTVNSTSFDSPILELESDNNGKNLSVAVTFSALDEALSLAGYTANTRHQLTLAVRADCLSKSTVATITVNVKRFATEILPVQLFLTGSATEGGSTLANAIALKRLIDSLGNASNRYEIYTHLVADGQYKFYSANTLPALEYGGQDGSLIKSGNAIVAAETGEYRISVDLDQMTYSLLKIEKWSVVGDPIASGWGGDEPLVYQGGGIWKDTVEILQTGNFAFRANGDWTYLLKLVKNTTNILVMESDAVSQGLEFQDIPCTVSGTCIFTLNLYAGGYNFTIEKVIIPGGITTIPETLYLLSDGQSVCEFTKDGNVFSSTIYLALQASKTYSLNSASDGTGTAYAIADALGTASTSDKVAGNSVLSEETGNITVALDQAYQLTVDFDAAKLKWNYYNMKLFHWSNWDTRDEFVMTYQHPYKFTVTANLKAGYEMKFNSPWEVEFGADDPSVITGTMTNKGGSNFTCISTDGSYTANITVANNYSTGSYEFVKQ